MELDWRTDSSVSDVSEGDDSERYVSERDVSERGSSERDISERDAGERSGSERDIGEGFTSERDASEREASEISGSERDASERSASERDASETSESERDASERGASERSESERDASERGASERSNSERDASERSGSERDASERSGSERDASEREASEREASEREASERSGSERDGSERGDSERESTELDPDWINLDSGSEGSRDYRTDTQGSASSIDLESTLREPTESVVSGDDSPWTYQSGGSSDIYNEDAVPSYPSSPTGHESMESDFNNAHSNPVATDQDNTLEYEPPEMDELPEVTIPEAQRPQSSQSNDQPTTSRGRERSPGGPPSKIRKKNDNTDVGDASDPDNDGATCSICLDSWSTSGEHRIVALKCGHLFGRSCVVRWLRSHSARERCCPTCKARAAERDIRCIYAQKLIAADTSEIDALKQQLEETKSEKNKVQLEYQATLMKERMYDKQLKELTKLLNSSKRTERKSGAQSWHFMLEKSLEIANDASCRTLAYNCRKYELYASQRSTAALFPGYGIRKVDCVNFKLGQFVFLHPKAIRDMRYSPVDDLLLTVALDGAAKLICGHSGQTSSTIKTEMPLWSCCWDCVQPTRLFLGGPGGVTLVYDTRNTSVPVERLTVPSDVSPVVSLASTPEGFLSCHLNSCWFYRRVGSEYRPSVLPFNGPFLSLSYEDHSRQMLISCRPTVNRSAHHIVAHLDLSADTVDCNTVLTYSGSRVQTLMSRSCQMRLGEQDWIAAHNESDGALSLYNTNNHRLMQSLAIREPIVDMCAMNFNGNHFLATLSQNKARIYKANAVSF